MTDCIAVPLHVPLPSDYKHITTMYIYGNQLILGVSGPEFPRLYCFPIIVGNDGTIQLGKQKVIGFKGMDLGKGTDFEISRIFQFHNSILVLIKAKNAPYGHLMMVTLNQGQNQISLVSKKVDSFVLDQYSSSNQTTIAISYANEIQILSYSQGNWQKVASNKFKEQIISFTLNYPNLLIAFPSAFMLYQISGKAINLRVPPWPVENSDNTFVMTVSPHHYYTYEEVSAVLVDDQLSSDNNPVSLTNREIDHAYIDTKYASIDGNRVAIFDFKNSIHVTYLSNCTHIIGYANGFKSCFFASTTNDLYSIISIRSLYEQLSAGSIESLEKSISPNFLPPFFSNLWLSNQKKLALSLLKLTAFQSYFYDVLDLFNLFIFIPEGKISNIFKNITMEKEHDLSVISQKQNLFQNIDRKNKSEEMEFIILLYELYNTLMSLQKNKSIPDCDTAIAEILIATNSLEQFIQFCEKEPKVSINSIDTFINTKKTKNSLYPVYLSLCGKYEEATESYKQYLDIPLIQDHFYSFIIKRASDWNFVSQQILYLLEYEKSQNNKENEKCQNYLKLASKILSNELIPPSKSLSFVKASCPKIYLLVLSGILDHKELLDRSSLVQEYVCKLSDLLIADSNEIQHFWTGSRSSIISLLVNALDRFESNINENTIQYILTSFNQYFSKYKDNPEKDTNDNSNNDDNINNINNNLKFHIMLLRSLKKDREALEVIWSMDEDQTSKIEKCNEYCQKAKNEETAFETMILFIKEKIDKQSFPEILMNLILSNMSHIDISSTLNALDGEIELNDIATLLEQTYLKMDSQVEKIKMEASVAESDQFQSEYELSLAKSKFIELNEDSVCAGCGEPLGYTYIIRTPDEKLYHFKCQNIHNCYSNK